MVHKLKQLGNSRKEVSNTVTKMDLKQYMSQTVSSISESGRVFTWGRGDYGQLGRQVSTSHAPELQSVELSGDREMQEACLPGEVKLLCGATQVRDHTVLHK